MIFKTGRMRMSLRNNEDGLTFLELCLVLLILGLLLAAATPKLSRSYEALKFKTAAKAVAADVDFAFSAAILSGRAHRLRLWPDGSGYTVEEKITAQAPAGFAPSAEVRWRSVRSNRLPEQLQLESDAPELIFSAAHPEKAAELRLVSEKHREARIVLRRGAVKVVEVEQYENQG